METVIPNKVCPVCYKSYTEGEVCPVDGAPLRIRPSDDPLIGKVLKGTYRVEEKIGQGGMGTVYRAVQLILDRPVAVKAIFDGATNSDEVIQRFLREAKLLSQIRHPNIVGLFDFGKTEDGFFFMVMEYLKGQVLNQFVPPDRGLPTALALDLFQQIAAGVEAAHQSQIVHRDLTPSNVFLANVGPNTAMVKLLDFGIAKSIEPTNSPLTQSGVMMGSCNYMAPEAIVGAGPIDLRADIYAMGGLLYFMLAGRAAYTDRSTRLILAKQISQTPDPIDFDALEKPEASALFAVILKAMHVDADQRFQTVGEMVIAVRAALVGTVLTAAPHRSTTIHVSDEALRGAELSTTLLGATANTTDRQNAVEAPDEMPERRASLNVALAGVLLAVGAFATGLIVFFNMLGNPGAPSSAKEIGQGTARGTSTEGRVRPVAPGVSDTEITWGVSAPFSGPARELSRTVKGIQAYFGAVNDVGGIAGRKLRLIPLDDGYEPPRALANMKQLTENSQIFGVIGNVGTPTAEVTLPFALEHHQLFFGAYTGASLLRKNPPDRFVFNYRASYREETEAIVKHLIETKQFKPDQIGVFAQKDGYGNAGFDGVARALRKYGRLEEPVRVGYERNTVEVAAAVTEILKHKELRAVIMIPTYRPAARFIQKLREAKSEIVCASVSFVGSSALADELQPLGPECAEGVIVSEVVPHPLSQSAVATKYREDLQKYSPGEPPSSLSFEGYINAMVLCKGLEKAGDNLTLETLVDALESFQNLDLGLGAPIAFSKSDHQCSRKVWLTVLDRKCQYHSVDPD